MGYSVKENAVFNEYDTEAGHINGKSSNPISSFGFDKNAVMGQKVIIIDDIITRGKTFNMTAEKLESLGASCVIGLFLAKTINPDWASRSTYYAEDYEPDYNDYDDYETYKTIMARMHKTLKDGATKILMMFSMVIQRPIGTLTKQNHI